MNHQDIADSLDALDTSSSDALTANRKRIARQQEILQQACAGLGHIYGHRDRKLEFFVAFDTRRCVVCGSLELVSA